MVVVSGGNVNYNMREKQSKKSFIYVLTLSVLGAGLIALSLPLFGHLAPAQHKESNYLQVDLMDIGAGETKLYKYENSHVYIRHLTRDERYIAQDVSPSELRDKQSYSSRFRLRPDGVLGSRYVVVYGAGNTGCALIADKGDYNGWYDACRSDHYDVLGRIRKGIGNSNMTVPNYKYISNHEIRIFPPVTLKDRWN